MHFGWMSDSSSSGDDDIHLLVNHLRQDVLSINLTISAAPVFGVTHPDVDSGTSFTPGALLDATLPIFRAWDRY